MLGNRWLNALRVLGLAALVSGCGNSVGTPMLLTAPTPTAIPAPIPTPATPIADGVLSGIIFEVTSTGRTGLQAATVYLLTCGAVNCPAALTAAREVKTDQSGAYRISGVYGGSLNFLWVRDEVFELVDPMPLGTCPDQCDRVVTINGDTRLDIDLRRR